MRGRVIGALGRPPRLRRKANEESQEERKETPQEDEVALHQQD
jgi:hypothetical protein